MVTPIETIQEPVRSDDIRGSYENGMKGVCSVQLGKWASSMSSVGPTRPFGELDVFGRFNSPNRRVGQCDWSLFNKTGATSAT